MSLDPAVRKLALPAARFDTLPDWLAWQEGLHVREIDLGLERCRSVAQRMGLEKPAYPVISVAGTNGKGSSVAGLSGILRAAGYRVGTYTSPHLLRYNERVRIEGQEASDRALCEAFNVIDQARGDISLTYFEFGTLAALQLFSEADLDIAVLEVGLGGRLDAVNLVDADVALITAIGIDHEDWLGSDRETIAREKAGILRAGKPAVCSDPDAPRSVVTAAAETGARLFRLGQDFSYQVASDTWAWFGPERRYEGLPHPGLHGAYQFQNAAGVLMALDLLHDRYPVSFAAMASGLGDLTLPGRFQVLAGPVDWILDVAHNPHAAVRLAETLGRWPCAGRTLGLLGMLRDKDAGGVLRELAPVVDVWHFASVLGRRGGTSEQLLDAWQTLGYTKPVNCHASVSAAFDAVRQEARAGDRIVVMGSFLTVGEVSRFLAEEPVHP
jgi:dihydrofolate synthase/folylpolyglutamate synthase